MCVYIGCPLGSRFTVKLQSPPALKQVQNFTSTRAFVAPAKCALILECDSRGSLRPEFLYIILGALSLPERSCGRCYVYTQYSNCKWNAFIWCEIWGFHCSDQLLQDEISISVYHKTQSNPWDCIIIVIIPVPHIIKKLLASVFSNLHSIQGPKDQAGGATENTLFWFLLSLLQVGQKTTKINDFSQFRVSGSVAHFEIVHNKVFKNFSTNTCYKM